MHDETLDHINCDTVSTMSDHRVVFMATTIQLFHLLLTVMFIGVQAREARGAAAPPNFGQLRFFGQQEKIWAKPAFKDVFMFFFISMLKR